MGDKKKQAKKTQVFLFPDINFFFFGMFFLSTKIKWFFSKNWQQFNARAGQKKTTCFSVVLGLPLMRALI